MPGPALRRRPRLQRSVAEGAGSSMSDLLLGAMALMLVVEGLLPFLSPGNWRRVFERAIRMSDGQIRFLGLSSMLVGLLLLAIWH